MTWWKALDPYTRQALILVGAGLVGALLAMIAQAIGARRSNRIAMTLFERQSTEQRQLSEATVHDGRHRAQVAERQQAYARLMSLAWQYERAVTDVRACRREIEQLRGSGAETPEALGEAELALAAASAHQGGIRDDLSQAREVVRLLAPGEIRFAADRWFIDLVRDEAAGAQRAKSDFLAHARVDVGADKPAPAGDATRPR